MSYDIEYHSKLKLSIFNDYEIFEFLQNKYKIQAQCIGSLKVSSKQNKILSPPFTLTLNETKYILEQEINNTKSIIINVINKDLLKEEYLTEKELIQYKVYKYLKNKDYYILSGIKYGTDFLIYEDDPQFVHSEYLVLISYNISLSEEFSILKCQRIAQNTKKILLVAYMEEDNTKLIKFKWKNI